MPRKSKVTTKVPAVQEENSGFTDLEVDNCIQAILMRRLLVSSIPFSLYSPIYTKARNGCILALNALIRLSACSALDRDARVICYIYVGILCNHFSSIRSAYLLNSSFFMKFVAQADDADIYAAGNQVMNELTEHEEEYEMNRSKIFQIAMPDQLDDASGFAPRM